MCHFITCVIMKIFFFVWIKETIMGCSRFVTTMLYGVLYRINKNDHVFDGFTNSSHDVLLLFNFQKCAIVLLFLLGCSKSVGHSLHCVSMLRKEHDWHAWNFPNSSLQVTIACADDIALVLIKTKLLFYFRY
jgi:hypothetical protein